MDLIDEYDDLVLELGCLVDDELDPLFELSTILGSCNHLRQIE